jgi:endonuclease/exonuclease/phosphatase (EEP) superfamily protein YafD
MKKTIILLFLIVIVIYAYYDGGVGSRQESDFRISYSNVGFKNNNSLEVTRKLLDTDADIILVTEWTGKNLDPIGVLSSGYKVIVDSPGNGTHGVFLLAKKNIGITSMMAKNPVPSPCGMPVLTASLQYQGKLITLLGVHAPPPVEACKNTTEKIVRYFAGLISDGMLAKDFGVGRPGDSVILVADLNTLPFNATIGDIEKSGLEDAHKRAGRFMGATWAPYHALPRLARIDYIFSSSDLNLQNLWNTRMPGSDHNLLVADYDLTH